MHCHVLFDLSLALSCEAVANVLIFAFDLHGDFRYCSIGFALFITPVPVIVSKCGTGRDCVGAHGRTDA